MQERLQYQSLLGTNTKFYPLTKKNIKKFQNQIYFHYHQNKRSFPWRNTTNPYHILISEYMLQQTQTSRVIKKYQKFIQRFPDFSSLVNAQTTQVLRYWSGLGYNRRALYLKNCAKIIHQKYHDHIPNSEKTLQKIPGIGPYTAAALMTFIYNKPVVLIETNIRSVYIHFFFHNRNDIDDKDLHPYIKKTIDTNNPREWYYALMDYGAMLKKQFPNPSRKSRHYYRQTTFEGSQRQIRGKIIKYLLTETQVSESQLCTVLKISAKEIEPILKQLIKDKILIKDELDYFLIEK
jgi:A/G-specific adenine glycosylase